MRISKLLSAVCVAAFFAGSPSVRAEDTPAQAAARAALMQKMSELDAQENQPTNPTPPSMMVKPSGVAREQAGQPKDATAPPRPPAAEAQANSNANADQAAAEAKAKQEAEAAAVAQAGAQIEKPAAPEVTPAVKQPPVIVVTGSGAEPAASGQPNSVMPAPARDSSGFFTLVPPPSNPAVPAGWQSAPQQNVSNLSQSPPPAKVSYSGRGQGFKPIEPPPPPVSAQKEAELQALLAKYMADQISPEQYHKKRAAILAEP